MNKPKFRAWDESDKKMIEWEHLINYCDIGYLFGGYDGGFGKEGPKSYEYPIPMQYTGLKDKNDVEIYEGDYIRYSGSKGTSIYIVTFENGAFLLIDLEYDEDSLLWENYKDLNTHWEVLGNIHTNPELLNEVE